LIYQHGISYDIGVTESAFSGKKKLIPRKIARTGSILLHVAVCQNVNVRIVTVVLFFFGFQPGNGFNGMAEFCFIHFLYMVAHWVLVPGQQ
jgi:hypothetical protein